MRLLRCTSKHPDFKSLVQELDAELAIRDGEEDHAFYHQFNSIEGIHHCIIGYVDHIPVACGAFKSFDKESVEIKRMYVPKTSRGKGFASRILQALEIWAKEIGYTYTILETGTRLPEAIALYKKYDYVQINNYGQYAGIKTSICFKKVL